MKTNLNSKKEEKAIRFWNWFVENEEDLSLDPHSDPYKSKAIRKELDFQLFTVHPRLVCQIVDPASPIALQIFLQDASQDAVSTFSYKMALLKKSPKLSNWQIEVFQSKLSDDIRFLIQDLQNVHMNLFVKNGGLHLEIYNFVDWNIIRPDQTLENLFRLVGEYEFMTQLKSFKLISGSVNTNALKSKDGLLPIHELRKIVGK